MISCFTEHLYCLQVKYYDPRRGRWILTVDDVLLDGRPFDYANSLLSINFRVK
jgi:hypothetical protein